MQKMIMKMKRISGILLAALILATVLCGPAVAHAEAKDQDWVEDYYNRLEYCAEQIREKTDYVPEIVIVLGTGLGDYVEQVNVLQVIPYSEIDGWPVSSAPTHANRLVFAEYKGLSLWAQP